MNREIRFRVWDLLFKKMLMLHDAKFIEGLMIGAKGINGFDGRVEVMQSTGLKDKNGKEIYEGDILVVVNLHDGDEYAWFQPNGPAIPCVVSWDDEYKRYDFEGCSRVLRCPYDFEVIGNIYENPELLESEVGND